MSITSTPKRLRTLQELGAETPEGAQDKADSAKDYADIRISQTANSLRNGFEENERTLWKLRNSNFSLSVISGYGGSPAGLFRSVSQTPDSAGTTNSAYLEIPSNLALQFSGQRVRVTVFAKRTDDSPSNEFALAYSTSEVGNSEWQKFTPTDRWERYFFEYDVPDAVSGGFDFIGVWADTSNSNLGVLIDSIQVQLESDVTAKAQQAQQAAQEYALAQADLAETKAKAHADGKITQSEARAIAEAQKKADAAEKAAIDAAKADAKNKADAAENAAINAANRESFKSTRKWNHHYRVSKTAKKELLYWDGSGLKKTFHAEGLGEANNNYAIYNVSLVTTPTGAVTKTLGRLKWTGSAWNWQLISSKGSSGNNPNIFIEGGKPKVGTYHSNPYNVDVVIELANVETNIVTSSVVQANAITSEKINSNAVVASKIASNAVIASKISANAVTSDKIKAGAITASKISTNSIEASHVKAGAIASDKLATNSVTAVKIASNSVTAAKIKAGSISVDKLASNSVTAAKIAAGAITADKIAANQIQTNHLKSGTVTSDKISVSELSAISATMGEVLGGVFRTNTVGEARAEMADAAHSPYWFAAYKRGNTVPVFSVSRQGAINMAGGTIKEHMLDSDFLASLYRINKDASPTGGVKSSSISALTVGSACELGAIPSGGNAVTFFLVGGGSHSWGATAKGQYRDKMSGDIATTLEIYANDTLIHTKTFTGTKTKNERYLQTGNMSFDYQYVWNGANAGTSYRYKCKIKSTSVALTKYGYENSYQLINFTANERVRGDSVTISWNSILGKPALGHIGNSNTWSGRNKFNAGIDFNNQIIAANGLGNSSNVDHIWYDDSGLGAWHFVADGSVKQQGNADVIAGKFKESGSYLQDKYAAKSHTHNYAPSSHNHDSKYAAKSHTHTQSVLLAKSGSGGWGYLRTQSGSKFWDLAVKDNDSSADFQIRPQGSSTNRYLFKPNGYLHLKSVVASDWVRTQGSTGWYNASYGGGIRMVDSTWIRTYGTKKFHVDNTSYDSIYTLGGVRVDKGLSFTSDTTLSKGNNKSLRVTSSNGYVEIGAQNTSHAHFYTDRSNFYFSKMLRVDGSIQLYRDSGTRLDTDGIYEKGTKLTDKYAPKSHTHNYAASAHTHSGHDVRVLGHRMTVASDGKIYANNSGYRQAGIYGIYDSYRVGHIWSMGTAYKIHAAGSNFGNLYGLAYKHTNNKSGGTMGGGHQMVWCTNGTPRAALGESGIWSKNNISAYSDARVKTNVVKIPNALDKVCRLNGYTYNRTDLEVEDVATEHNPKGRQVGVIAQEVVDVLPEAVTGGPTQDDPDGHYSVSYGNMVALLIEAVKDLRAEIQELKGERL